VSTREATTIMSRVLATYFLAWALSDITYVPGLLYSFFHHVSLAGAFGTNAYYSNSDSISLSFHAVRIVVLLIASKWFYRAGPAVHDFLLGPAEMGSTPSE
jgi:hypothetical protein